MNTNVIELRNVEKHYERLRALDGLGLTVRPGEVLGLLGHNGAGKTTTMKLILGLTSPTRGEVRVFERNPAGKDSERLRRRIGYLPENVSFYDQLSGREVLDYFAALKAADRAQRDALLEQVGLGAAAERRVKTYSKGMRQRLGLAQALLGQPQLLLLDEPTVGLDPVATQAFYTTLDALRQQGTTVILCSHVLPGIEAHVDRVAIMDHGRLLACGTPQALREEADLPVTIRVCGQWQTGLWEPLLAQRGITRYRVNGTHLELQSSASKKMAIMRLLLEQPDVVDIDVVPASLQTLYLHYSNPSSDATSVDREMPAT